MSDDCTSNPHFCNFLSGIRDEPVVVTGLDGKAEPLHFRGKPLIGATLQTLLTLGLDKAKRMLLRRLGDVPAH